MNIAELKLEIIAKVMATDDEVLLNKINEILDSYELNSLLNEPTTTYEKVRAFSDDEVRVFTPEQRKRIEKSLEQVKNGECISDEEAQKEIEKWFEDQE